MHPDVALCWRAVRHAASPLTSSGCASGYKSSRNARGRGGGGGGGGDTGSGDGGGGGAGDDGGSGCGSFGGRGGGGGAGCGEGNGANGSGDGAGGGSGTDPMAGTRQMADFLSEHGISAHPQVVVAPAGLTSATHAAPVIALPRYVRSGWNSHAV